jgi:aryl-alcohol dehydrogenase-like predicted oxidoreductase
MAQLALAWLLAQGDQVIPIPGTTRIDHLEENLGAADLKIDPSLLARAGRLINQNSITGPRYSAASQAEIDTEAF